MLALSKMNALSIAVQVWYTLCMNTAALTIPQVAERLSVSEATVRRLLRSGKLPGVRVGRQWRVPPEQLDAYLRGKDPVATP